MKKKLKNEEEVKIDFGVGTLSLGGLFKGMERLIDIAAELKKAGGEIRKEGDIDLSHLKKGMKGVYGISIKTVVDGKPIIETFGNIRKTNDGPVVEEEREPLTDIFDEKDEIIVIAEVPGVQEEGISLEVEGDILVISAAGKNRKYRQEVLLPQEVEKENLSYSYKNGMLEIRIKKS